MTHSSCPSSSLLWWGLRRSENLLLWLPCLIFASYWARHAYWGTVALKGQCLAVVRWGRQDETRALPVFQENFFFFLSMMTQNSVKAAWRKGAFQLHTILWFSSPHSVRQSWCLHVLYLHETSAQPDRTLVLAHLESGVTRYRVLGDGDALVTGETHRVCNIIGWQETAVLRIKALWQLTKW